MLTTNLSHVPLSDTRLFAGVGVGAGVSQHFYPGGMRPLRHQLKPQKRKQEKEVPRGGLQLEERIDPTVFAGEVNF